MKNYLSTLLIFSFIGLLQQVGVSQTFSRQIDLKNAESRSSEIVSNIEQTIEAGAASDGNGVLIEWNPTSVNKNLGFNIYRVEGKRQIRLTDELIAGTAIKSGDDQFDSNYSYRFFDSEGSLQSEYIIEIVDLSVQSKFFGKFSVAYDASLSERLLPNSKTLSDLGKRQETNDFQREVPAPPDSKEFFKLNSESFTNPVTQRWVAAQQGAKISVIRDGLYRVTRAELATTNFNLNAPVANWQLYADGVEQPIIVNPNGDFIEFYGRSIDTPTSGTRVYYLVAGESAGRRIQMNSRRLNATRVGARNFNTNLVRKDRYNYTNTILNGDEENWWGAIITPSNVTNVPVQLKGVDPSVPQATINVKLRGLTSVSHSVLVKLNNVELGTITGSFTEAMQREFTVPTSILVNGTNTFSFITGASGDICFFDTTTVSYARRYEADANRLTFTTANLRATYLEGFTNPSNVRVFDITDPNGTSLVSTGIDGSNVFVGANRPRLMYAVANDAVFTAAAVSSNEASNFLETAQNKDLLIITHANFIAQAENLATYRRGQGMTVSVIKVDDLYDESSFGSVSTAGFRSFFQAVTPRYIVLLGDSTFDPRNYSGIIAANNLNFVLTGQFETLFGEAVSDDPLADLNNDNVADFPIGRLSARDTTTAQTLVNKIMTFEATVSTALSQRGALFVCDNPDGYDFCGSVERLRNRLPQATPVRFVRRSDGDVATVRQQIINEINNGRYLVAFSGHGTSNAWTNGNIFNVADIPQLTNAENLNLFLPMNCLNGAFADPFVNVRSLAEEMTRKQGGGSVAAWASSGLTFPDSQEQMGLRFFQSIGTGEFARIGDAIRTAKLATPDRDVRLSWIFLGDPSMKIR